MMDSPQDAAAELDRLNAASHADPQDIDAQIALWTAVCRLEEWFFVNRGTAEAPRPYGLAAEAGMTLCLYSSPERAQAGARANGLVADDEPAPLFRIPLPQALDWVLSLREAGVSAVVLDYPEVGAWTPVGNLASLRRPPSGTATPPPITDALRSEARNRPGGHVYVIDPAYAPDGADGSVAPAGIVGAYPVDADGNVVPEFVPNPNYGAAASDPR